MRIWIITAKRNRNKFRPINSHVLNSSFHNKYIIIQCTWHLVGFEFLVRGVFVRSWNAYQSTHKIFTSHFGHLNSIILSYILKVLFEYHYCFERYQQFDFNAIRIYRTVITYCSEIDYNGFGYRCMYSVHCIYVYTYVLQCICRVNLVVGILDSF